MLTIAITAGITAVLRFFGLTPSAYVIGGIAIGVKVTIIAGATLLGLRLARKKKAAAALAAPVEAEAPVPPTSPPSEKLP
jgi:hypothetical protein